MSILHEIDDEQKARQEKHIDETYEDFLQKVSADAIERSLTSNDLPLPR